MIQPADRAVPEAAGTDVMEITLEETYEVEGIGTDTVALKGTFIAERAAPLLGPEASEVDWETATVVAKFTALSVSGHSKVFGPVSAVLDPSSSAMAAVKNGACAAVVPVIVSMPEHQLTLRTAQPMQLRSTVRHVPPIGDEQTVSVQPVELVDVRTRRTVGRLYSARVMWRELTAQLPVD